MLGKGRVVGCVPRDLLDRTSRAVEVVAIVDEGATLARLLKVGTWSLCVREELLQKDGGGGLCTGMVTQGSPRSPFREHPDCASLPCVVSGHTDTAITQVSPFLPTLATCGRAHTCGRVHTCASLSALFLDTQAQRSPLSPHPPRVAGLTLCLAAWASMLSHVCLAVVSGHTDTAVSSVSPHPPRVAVLTRVPRCLVLCHKPT